MSDTNSPALFPLEPDPAPETAGRAGSSAAPRVPQVNYRVGDRDFKYYIFDWDDNILHMPTYIHLERRLEDGTWIPHLVSTSLYAVIRSDTVNYRPPGGDWNRAFVEFRDFATDDESKFLKDTRTALDRLLSGIEKPPPSFGTFRRTIVDGRIFAIVTARGHQSVTLRRGVEMFIDRVLTDDERRRMIANLRGYIACFDNEEEGIAMTDEQVLSYYLDLNRYHAVTSPQFERLIEGKVPDPESSETRKQFAIRDFIEHVFQIIDSIGVHRPISVGFSDDDPANVRAVSEYIREELGRRFPAVKFVVYDTSDPTLEKGHKVVISGQLDLGLL